MKLEEKIKIQEKIVLKAYEIEQMFQWLNPATKCNDRPKVTVAMKAASQCAKIIAGQHKIKPSNESEPHENREYYFWIAVSDEIVNYTTSSLWKKNKELLKNQTTQK